MLEERINFSVDLTGLGMTATVESYDGTGNNLANSLWGSAGTDFLRKSTAEYADGVDDPSGADRPSARLVSNLVAAHPDSAILNDRDLSAFIYAWGQFLDHDVDLTNTGTPAEKFNIAVPTGDAWFDPNSTGTQTLGLTRSQYDSATGTGVNNIRQQVNSITAYIDGSQIYGSDAATAASLRTFSGGRLKTSEGNLLPTAADGSFLAGDIRVNENIELISMQTLFLREHNRLADGIAKANPKLTDEQIFQQARRIVIAELQVITYKEFIPALLGEGALKSYAGYNAGVNAGISNEFAAVGFRIGHSMLGSDVEFLDNNGNEVREAVALRDAFFNPGLIKETGIDSVLKYLASDRAEEIDTKVVDDVRNFLFGAPGQGGLDLASLNIQRGRDHGLPDYNDMRAAYGLKKVTSFAQITSDVELQKQLQAAYGTVDKIDAWVGGLAEKHQPGSSVGELFSRILVDQFTRLRDGDRFWYQNTFSKADVQKLEQTTLADVIRNNTTTTNLQRDVFFFHASISGSVFQDANADGLRKAGELGAAGIHLQLLDSVGTVVATARTDALGNYTFKGLDLGQYTIREQTPADAKATTTTTVAAAITRGMDIRHVDFGITKLQKPTTPPPPPAPPAPPKPLPSPPPPPVKLAAGGEIMRAQAEQTTKPPAKK
ncbi:MAG: peroxidase [Pirellula sp.]|nr:peroxidase [Pirellula sp.]